MDKFYLSKEWAVLRKKVLYASKFTCARCGHSAQKRMHVDHIVPRRKAPELSLAVHNLQVLCEHCHNSIKQIEERSLADPIDANGYPPAWR